MINLRPSNSYRWSNCPAAPTFEERSPAEPDSDAAREGTAAAWVADCVLKGDASEADDMIGRTHANGWFVTLDMAQHVQGYINLIKSRGGVTTTEQFVRLTSFIAGTLDASTSIDTANTLHVDDLKYGFKLVEIFENPQLIIYGAAELTRLNAWLTVAKISLGIYQPRAFHPEGIYRTWTVTPQELWAMAQDLINRGQRCQEPAPVAIPGRHCDNCRAASSCAALAASIYAGYHVVEDRRQRHMTAIELANELKFIRIIEQLLDARSKAIEKEAEERMRGKGEHIPGFHMKTRYGHRRFKYPPQVVSALTGISAVDTVNVTPAEMERRGANVAVVAELTETPVIGHKVDAMPENHIRKSFESRKG